MKANAPVNNTSSTTAQLVRNQRAVLLALFDMARGDRAATVIRLMEVTGLTRADVIEALGRLDRTGYADAERVRLTMGGLAACAMLGGLSHRRPSVGTKSARALRAA